MMGAMHQNIIETDDSKERLVSREPGVRTSMASSNFGDTPNRRSNFGNAPNRRSDFGNSPNRESDFPNIGKLGTRFWQYSDFGDNPDFCVSVMESKN